MPIRNLTLGLCLLLAGSALAQNQTYKVREGDSIERIAKKFQVKEKSILQANGLKATTILKVGRAITIPNVSVASDEKSSQQVSAKKDGYTVKTGENDWTLAKRFGITPHQLRKMNPSVNWSNLKVGQALNVPSGKSAPATIAAAKMPAIAKLAGRFAIVNANDVTVRKVAGTTAPAIDKVDLGARVYVLKRTGDWYHLSFEGGAKGWIRGDFLKSVPAPVVAKAQPKPKPVSKPVKAAPAKVAKAPKPKAPVRVAMNTVAPGSRGTGSSLLEKARTFRGVRYRWGGMSRSGTDCSGFTSQVFKANGITLPRTSGAQATVGKPVNKGDLKAGDLVFFRTSRGSRITHVGMYTGNGKFIHASSGGGRVQENSLAEGYYSSRFVTARRLTKAEKKAMEQAEIAKHEDPDPVIPQQTTDTVGSEG